MSDERVRALLREIERELEGTGRTIYDVLGLHVTPARPRKTDVAWEALKPLVDHALAGMLPVSDGLRSVVTLNIEAVGIPGLAPDAPGAWSIGQRNTWMRVSPAPPLRRRY